MSTLIDQLERRNITIEELRIDEKDKERKITGYAAVFNSMSEDLGGFKEQIQPGAFGRSLKRDDVRALFNHDPNYVLGRNKAGTLKLKEDETGLRFEITPPDTSYARDLMESVRRGDINQMSFGFNTVKDSWNNDSSGTRKETIRTLEEVRLFDVSLVTYPAYQQTSASVRDYINALKENETKLDEQSVLNQRSDSLKKRFSLR